MATLPAVKNTYHDRLIRRLLRDYPWESGKRRGWNGCTMVNSLCPSDLCLLPPGHEGTSECIHWLGTCVDPIRLNRRAFRMAPDIGVPHTEESLIALGWALDYKLNPKEFVQVFGQQINIEEMIKWPE